MATRRIAAWWYPANDHPRDKASYDVSVAVPTGLEAISNGTFAGTRTQTDGWVRWNWRSAGPQGTYQTVLVVGDYEINHRTTPDGQPFITAYGTELADSAAARASVECTPEITAYLRSWVASNRGGTATTEEFTAHAERVAGRQLDDLFRTWLFTPGKPPTGPNVPF